MINEHRKLVERCVKDGFITQYQADVVINDKRSDPLIKMMMEKGISRAEAVANVIDDVLGFYRNGDYETKEVF